MRTIQKSLKNKGIGFDNDGRLTEDNPEEESVLTRGYLINFDEGILGEKVISDKQRVGDKFSFVNNSLYKFIDITKDIQHKFESLGYLFFMSNKFSIIILEDKRK